MRWTRALMVAVGLALVALPVSASIKALNLYELMELTVETFHGKILSRDTVVCDQPWEGCVYTRLTIEGTSMRTHEPLKTQVVFLGSHDPADRFNHSEMPELRDIRVGNEAVFFWDRRDDIFEGAQLVYDLSGAYRVERGFGEAVVIGKGGKFAFPQNTKLTEVSKRVRATHLAIEADRQAKAEALQQEGK